MTLTAVKDAGPLPKADIIALKLHLLLQNEDAIDTLHHRLLQKEATEEAPQALSGEHRPLLLIEAIEGILLIYTLVHPRVRGTRAID